MARKKTSADPDLAEVVPLVGDDSTLPPDVLGTLREMVWRRCVSDLRFFLEQYWHIEQIGKGYQLVGLRQYQVSEIGVFQEACNRERIREVRLKARQIGFTTLDAGGAFWSAFFHPHHPWLIASQGEDDAKGTLKLRIKTPYLMLPRWMRERGPTLQDDSSEIMTFDNGSWILSIPSTAKSGRSKAVFGVLLDEGAYVELLDELIAALDPLCYGPLFLFSTANGMGNPFHAKWLEAQRRDSEWNRLSKDLRPDEPFSGAFQPWTAVPERDGRWYAREYRKYRGREWLFYQEYPASPEEAFAKSGRTAFPIDLLRNEQHFCEPQLRFDPTLINLAEHKYPLPEALVTGDEEHDLELWVWNTPTVDRDPETGQVLRKPNYVVGCDVAEGLEHGDRTSIWVMDANTLEQVASLRGHYPLEGLGELLEWLGYYYHTALLTVERNNSGLVPLDYLQRHGYPRLYRMDAIAAIRLSDRTPRYGWHTNRGTKPKMVNDFLKALRDSSILLHDERFLEEAVTFVADGKGGFGASSSNHDDHVLGALIAWQGCLDVGQYPIIWSDPLPGPVSWGQLAIINFGPPVHAPLDQGIGQGKARPIVRHSFFTRRR